MKGVRPYEHRPPPTTKTVDLAQFPFALIKVEVDVNPNKKGLQKYKLSLPPAVRSRHLEDPVYGPSWKDIIHDFDSKLLERNPEQNPTLE